MFGVGLHAARADSGSVVLTVFKGGWIIGGSAGHGTLKFGGRTYALWVGGIDYGLVFGGSKTVLRGSVKNIKRASDVAGVYAAASKGLAVGGGARAIVLTNQKGAVLELSGKQARTPGEVRRSQRPRDYAEMTGRHVGAVCNLRPRG